MFKKTLIAAAVVATTATFGAAASTVAVTAETVGVEYAQGIQQVLVTPVTMTTGRDYNAGDIISFDFTGATVATKTAAATPADIVPAITGTMAGAVEFLEYAGNSVKFLVTNTTTVLSGATLTATGIELLVSDAADKGKVKVTTIGKVDTVEGAKVVDASTAADVLIYTTQIASKILTNFDGVVDVNAQRTKFTGGATADTLVIDNTVNATLGARGVTTTGSTYTVFGDFSFLDENSDGDLGDAKDGSVASAAGTIAVAADMMSATVVSTAAVSTGTVGITVNTPAGVVIPDQDFMASLDISYTDPAGGATDKVAHSIAKSDAGSWTLNGHKAHVPFMPFGSDYAQSVTISNTSTQTGGVDLVLYVGDDAIEVPAIATVGAEGVTDISAAVRTAVANAGLSTANVSFDIIVNAPNNDVKVVAVYYSKADGDRVRVD